MADEGEIIPARVLHQRFRRMAAAQVILVLAMTYGFWQLQQQQEDADRQRETIRVGACTSTITGRATQMMFADVLVAASQTNGDTVTEQQQRRIDAFTSGVEGRLLGELPPTCRGVMGFDEFRERVNTEARPPPATGGVSLGG